MTQKLATEMAQSITVGVSNNSTYSNTVNSNSICRISICSITINRINGRSRSRQFQDFFSQFQQVHR